MTLYKRLFRLDKDSTSSYFLFGPRGTGKTSWLTANLPGALYFDLLHDDTYTKFLAEPSRLASLIPKGFQGWVIIDEVQRIPELLNEVHRLIEKENFRFILTGSSARKLRRKGVNLLAGRALLSHMHPLTAKELGNDFDLQHALRYGCLPSVIGHHDPSAYLTSYTQTYLREEVLQESITRNLALFTRFLEVASFSQGETINYTNIAQEVGSNRHTISNFFDVTEDLLIAIRIPPFTKRAKREVVMQSKFYFFDCGVFRTIRPKGPLDSEQEVDGPTLETLFLQHLRAYNDYFALNYTIHFWRTRKQAEVDFVLYGEHGLLAFEVKRKTKLNKSDFKGLRLFQSDYPEAKCYMIYGGTSSYHFDGVQVIPIKEIFDTLPEIMENKP